MHETIQARLMSFIRERQMVAGDRLPSQAVLTQALGISLVALREAMRALEALGIIERGRDPAGTSKSSHSMRSQRGWRIASS